jgi:hypothetical protein
VHVNDAVHFGSSALSCSPQRLLPPERSPSERQIRNLSLDLALIEALAGRLSIPVIEDVVATTTGSFPIL